MDPRDAILPAEHPKKLCLLTESQYQFWRENGYVALEGVVPLDLCQAASQAIRTFVGADADWYANQLDIYTDTLPNGKRPKHGPCGMVQMCHHDSLWRIRQHPAVHAAFTDVYGTEQLWVTVDRAHFKPPEHPDHPAWSHAGPVHTGLHWDVCVDKLPVPMAVQGVVYLEDTVVDQGPLHVVPGSFHRIPELREQRTAQGPESFDPVPVPGRAGTLVLWHSATLHGPGRNTSQRPRISAYVAMLPVDATPFQPRHAPSAKNTPLSLADAGTLLYDDAAAPTNPSASSLQRLTREQRIARWQQRLPLLNEDPREEDIEAWPPGEVQAQPFADLSPLGRKLVGLDAW